MGGVEGRGRRVAVELTILVLIVALPLAGLSAFLLYDTARRDEVQSAGLAMQMAVTTADRAERYIETTHRALEAIARRPLIRAMDPNRCDPQLAELSELYGRPANLVVINLEGRIICGATPPPRDKLLRTGDQALLKAMIAEPRFRLSRPFVGVISKRWTVAAAQPIFGEPGKLVGQLSMGIDLQNWVSFSSIPGEPKGTVHDILNAEGTVIARSAEAPAWIGKSGGASEIHHRMLEMKQGTARARGTEGADRLWGFTPVTGTDWFARSSVSANRVFGPVRERALETGFLLAVVFGVAFVAVVAFVARLVRPMQRIAAAVGARAAGQADVRVPETGPREVAELAAELNRMIAAGERRERELSESEERFRRTFELAGSGVAHIGLDRRFKRVNRRLCEILGYAEAELIGLTGREISHPEDMDVINAQRPRLYAGELDAVRLEKRYVRKDGTIVWVAFTMTVERDAGGQALYEIAIFDEITSRRQAEASLLEAHEELKRSNAELEQFAYVASHDLQEPLRMVASYTQLLGRRYADKLDGDAKEFMAFIVDGAARMKQLIEDLLAYSRVGTRGKDFKPVRLEAALERARGNLRAALEESGGELTHDPLPVVEGDETQFVQLLQNLAGNALKFRGAAPPKIHVSSLEKETEYEITVRDNGIGIEAQYFERIFMVFQRLHDKGRYAGTGIGLAICKKVVDRHGGRIWVESTPGQGSAFKFALPKPGRR